jgi:threonine aldolase
MNAKYDFASDNTAAICPEAWAALADANHGFAAAYGEDDYTARATDLFREVFETDCDVYFVFNGTAANSLALAAMCQSYHGVIAHCDAHIEADECGAPQFFSNGVKLLTAQGAGGKLDAAAVERTITQRSDIHFPKPRVVSLTLPTEHGTLYAPGEIAAISAVAETHGLKVHIDGARFANAVAASGVAPAELTWKVGVDVMCCGGTKIGMGLGEAVIFFDRTISGEFAFRCKQAGQLASKMRYLSAPWIAMLRDGAWTRRAAHANACARRLARLIDGVPGIALAHPVEVNAVFLDMPETVHAALAAAGWHYYRFFGGRARFMCSWATTDAAVDALASGIAAAAQDMRGI